MDLIQTDGGRAAAGFDVTKPVGDSTVRALAIAMQRPYADVHKALTPFAKDGENPDNGIEGSTAFETWLGNQGWTKIPVMKRGEGTTVHLKADELPTGRLIVQVSKQLVAVIDGVQHNSRDWSREGTRAVYAYWSK